jgi:hypothetical protein
MPYEEIYFQRLEEEDTKENYELKSRKKILSR